MLPSNWQSAILRGVGAPVTPSNIHLLNTWQRAEGGGTANDANFNPLNTTQTMNGARSINSVGVKSYRSAAEGIQATVQTLLNGHYGPILAGLRSNASPVRIAQAIAASPWGAGEGVLHLLGRGGGGSSPLAVSPAAGPRAVPAAPGSLSPAPPSFKLPQITLPDVSGSLARIAEGWKPTETLQATTDSLLQQMLRGPSLVPTPRDLRGHSVQQTLATPAPATPSGSWDGTYGPATALAHLGEQFGLVPTSQKRDTRLSASGLVSDHWVGSKNAYAYDLGGSVPEMDQAARALTKRLGIPYSGGTLVATKVLNGLRYQLLYRTNVGGDHYNHIHVGVKRVG